ncbi:MAG: hypothetical protein ACRD12_04110 [Acidimicrobiales bacterium]
MTATPTNPDRPHRTARRSSVVIASLAVCSTLFLASPSAQGSPISTIGFDATFSASFSVEDLGRSALFIVRESGSGEEERQGAFTYTSSVIQDLRRRPAGCGPNSSRGVTGSATLSFVDGDLRLLRLSGEACFSFPFVEASEDWVATSGTGSYRGATGHLAREWVGDVRSQTAMGAWTGELRLISS